MYAVIAYTFYIIVNLRYKELIIIAKYLDTNGASHLVDRIKSLLATKSDVNHKHTSSDVTEALGYTPPREDTNTTYILTQDSSNKRKLTLSPSTGIPTSVTIPEQEIDIPDATTTVSGLMSSSDKTKLNGVASGAEVNQNAFSNVKVGTTTIAADSKTDTFTIEAGQNVNLSPDASSDKVVISATDTTYNIVTQSSEGLMSASDKRKLDGIAEGATAQDANTTYTLTQDASDGHKITLTASDGTSETVTIPDNNTTYQESTTSSAGLMSASDKSKLNGIASGAEVNQSAFSNVKVGSTTIAADSKTDTVEVVAGSNVTITPDASTDKITISAEDTKYNAATSSTAGLMSASDKRKLDGIEEGATASDENTTYTLTQDSTDGHKITLTPSTGQATTITIPDNNTTYQEATTSAAGLMSASDKSKLNGVTSGAEVNQSAFSNVKVGSTTIAADSKTDTLEVVAGSNVTLTPDSSSDKLTISATDTKYSAATTSTAGLMSASDKAKLDGIESGATNTVDTNTTYTLTQDSSDGHKITLTPSTGTATTITIPDNNTTYSDATTSAHGLMTAADKTKLNGIATGAEVNQSAFSNIKVGSTTVAADSKTDTLELVAGSNVTLTPDATNDKVTIASTDTNTTYTISKSGSTVTLTGSDGSTSTFTDANTTYSAATTSAQGLMSASDKSKLDGISTGAEVNQSAFSNVKVGDVTVAADSKTDTLTLVAGSNVTLTPDATNDKVTIASTNTTYSAATTSAAGLMSASDKSKLDGIESGAQVNKVTGVKGSSESSYRTGNVNITAANVGAAAASHTHAASDVTSGTFGPERGGTGKTTLNDAANALVNSLGEGTSPATADDYIVAQYAAGGTTTTTYHRRKLSNIFKALSQSDVTTALGYTPPTSDTNTTYTLTQDSSDGHKLTFTPSSGSATTITIPDNNTTYSDVTTSAHGLMTAADKTKLNGIATGAEVNQNAFSNVKVGSTTVSADGKTDTLELVAGSNVTLTPDATNDKVTIAATDTTYSDVTTSAHGLMTAADKTKLNGVATGAEVNQNAFSNVKVGSTTVSADSKTDTLELVAGSNVTLTPDATNDKVTIAATNTTYSVATTSANGLMSSSDKSKLDGITAGATPNPYEANLQWGGKNFSGSYGCVDAAMIEELGPNRLAFFKAAGITIEYSRDGGSTWTDYGATDTQKVGLFSTGQSFSIGKADSTNKATANTDKYMLRVTLSTSPGGVYTALNKFAIYLSTNGSSNSTVTIEKALESTPTTYTAVVTDVPISGWSGWNIINISAITTYGNTASSQYGRIRFTFKANGGNTSYTGLQITKIKGYGGMGWTTPSYMAASGHLYSYDANQNATFPAQITATAFNGTATTATNVANSGEGTTNANRHVWFSDSSTETKRNYDNDFMYNPSTNTLTVPTINGTATTAQTANKLTGFSSQSATMSWGNQTGTPITRMDDSDGGSLGFRKNNPASGQMSMLIDGTVYINEGNTDVGDAIKSITRSGTTFTYTTLSGKTGTFTQQDNNTTYSEATTSANGLMSSSDKSKLNGIASGAEVNQNAFSNVTVGSTTIAADGKTDTLTLAAGSNITLTPDATNDKVTIAATDTTYSDATTSAHGLMTAADKTKLNGIATGAEVNQNAFSNVTVGSTTISADGKTDTLTLAAGSNITLTPDATNDKVTIAATNTTYSNMGAATASAAGTSGLVPAPAAGKQNSFLRGDGTWVVPTNTTYSNMGAATASAAGTAGLVPAPAAGKQNSFLRGDGTWVVPTDTNTTYSASSPISLSGTTFSHATSGVTAATYGTNSTTALTPGFGSTFSVPGFAVNTYGHVTSASSHTVKIPNAAATTSAAGLMSAADKTRFNGVAANPSSKTSYLVSAVSSIRASYSGYLCNVCSINDSCKVTLSTSGNGAWFELCTLPAAYRPTNEVSGVGVVGATAYAMSILTTGIVRIYTKDSFNNGYLHFNLTYPLI